MDQQTAFRIFVELGHYFSWIAVRDDVDPIVEKGQFILDHLVTKHSRLFQGYSVEEIEEIRIAAAKLSSDALDKPKLREKILRDALIEIPAGYMDKGSVLALQIVFLNTTPENKERIEEAAESLLRVLPIDEKIGEEAFRTFKCLYG